VSFILFHLNVVILAIVLLHRLSYFIQQFYYLLRVVFESTFEFLPLLLDVVDESFDQLVELLVERTNLVLSLFREHFSDDLAVILVESNFTLEND